MTELIEELEQFSRFLEWLGLSQASASCMVAADDIRKYRIKDADISVKMIFENLRGTLDVFLNGYPEATINLTVQIMTYAASLRWKLVC